MSLAKRVLAGMLILVVAATVLFGGHFYIAQRLVFDPDLEGAARLAALAAIGSGFACLLLQPFAERLVAPPWNRLVAWPASIWMGVAFLFLLVLGAGDALRWIAGGVAHAAGNDMPAFETSARLQAALSAALVAVAGAAGLREALRPPRLVKLEIALARWPRALDGFRIAQISDIHIGPLRDRRFSRHLTSRVNALAPDLICVTGDLVDGSARLLADEVAPFGELRARHGVFFVTGNHDHYSGADSWVRVIEGLGLVPLRNRHVEIRRGGAAFTLAGVDDHRGGFGDGQREDLPRALAGRDPGLPVLLLAHDPNTFKKASQSGVDLQLSGHTHGGQIWPFRYLVRLAVPFVAGRYARGGAELYVSRGTGFWGPPMRLFAPAEITEITVRRATDG
ncbi:MAG TPA: metallophosphoesterase [Myxococcota bacterium]|nr:metallophosphoesterase [Myxococcota bacterium]